MPIATNPTITPPQSPKNSREPIYPRRPFASDLSTVISKLPAGFQELATTGLLSIQLMNRLTITRSQVVHLMATAPDDERNKEWKAVLSASRPLERMTWRAVLVYHLRSSTYLSNCRELAAIVLECAQSGTNSQAEYNCLLWGACMLVATPDVDSRIVREQQTVLTMLVTRYPNLSFDQMVDISMRYFWSDGLSMSLRNMLASRTMP